MVAKLAKEESLAEARDGTRSGQRRRASRCSRSLLSHRGVYGWISKSVGHSFPVT